jgi:dTDP-4-amino-4,6-dideoxygalactose transaminase
MKPPFEIVKEFEDAVAEFTGAPYCVAVNSCTNALFLCLKSEYNNQAKENAIDTVFGVEFPRLTYIEIPKLTYISVPMQIIHAGFKVCFRDEDWHGIYQLKPFNIYDAARRFTVNMWNDQKLTMAPVDKLYMCTSHHWGKILGIQQGGCILHDDGDADAWFREARFDGRVAGVHPKQQALRDDFTTLGYHCYMSPEVAAEGLVRINLINRVNSDLPRDNYPDLSLLSIFK